MGNDAAIADVQEISEISLKFVTLYALLEIEHHTQCYNTIIIQYYNSIILPCYNTTILH